MNLAEETIPEKTCVVARGYGHRVKSGPTCETALTAFEARSHLVCAGSDQRSAQPICDARRALRPVQGFSWRRLAPYSEQPEERYPDEALRDWGRLHEDRVWWAHASHVAPTCPECLRVWEETPAVGLLRERARLLGRRPPLPARLLARDRAGADLHLVCTWDLPPEAREKLVTTPSDGWWTASVPLYPHCSHRGGPAALLPEEPAPWLILSPSASDLASAPIVTLARVAPTCPRCAELRHLERQDEGWEGEDARRLTVILEWAAHVAPYSALMARPTAPTEPEPPAPEPKPVTLGAFSPLVDTAMSAAAAPQQKANPLPAPVLAHLGHEPAGSFSGPTAPVALAFTTEPHSTDARSNNPKAPAWKAQEVMAPPLPPSDRTLYAPVGWVPPTTSTAQELERVRAELKEAQNDLREANEQVERLADALAKESAERTAERTKAAEDFAAICTYAEAALADRKQEAKEIRSLIQAQGAPADGTLVEAVEKLAMLYKDTRHGEGEYQGELDRLRAECRTQTETLRTVVKAHEEARREREYQAEAIRKIVQRYRVPTNHGMVDAVDRLGEAYESAQRETLDALTYLRSAREALDAIGDALRTHIGLGTDAATCTRQPFPALPTVSELARAIAGKRREEEEPRSPGTKQ